MTDMGFNGAQLKGDSVFRDLPEKLHAHARELRWRKVVDARGVDRGHGDARFH